MGTSAPAVPTEHAKGSPAWLVQQAKDLERERAELLKKIGANRELLRSLAKVGALNASEAKFVSTFYPEKEKGEQRSKEEQDATRKAREAARQ